MFKKIIPLFVIALIAISLYGCAGDVPYDLPSAEKSIADSFDSEFWDSISTNQKNALNKADSYLQCSAFSYDGLVGQLEYEGIANRTLYLPLINVVPTGKNKLY